MRVLIFAILSLVAFGNLHSENQKLKKTNSALLRALRSLTADKEKAVGDECNTDSDCDEGYTCQLDWFNHQMWCSWGESEIEHVYEDAAEKSVAETYSQRKPYSRGDCIDNCDRYDAPCSCCNVHCQGDQHLFDQCQFARCGGRADTLRAAEKAVGDECNTDSDCDEGYTCQLDWFNHQMWCSWGESEIEHVYEDAADAQKAVGRPHYGYVDEEEDTVEKAVAETYSQRKTFSRGDCIDNCDRWDAPCHCCNTHCQGDQHLFDQCQFARCGGRATFEKQVGGYYEMCRNQGFDEVTCKSLWG